MHRAHRWPARLVVYDARGDAGRQEDHDDRRLEQKGTLHPLQSAFIEHDGFQCGFCTSGQIMSGVAMIAEAKAGWPSAASADVRTPFTLADLSHAEIRERMSGNLCRCACYPNIVDAVAEVVARS
jgi:Aerobic-type carbon monoxide dehydrogenase, small subunit CoxS/CutS homologs